MLASFLGETDWKVIVIDVTDPLAKDLNGICSSTEKKIDCLVIFRHDSYCELICNFACEIEFTSWTHYIKGIKSDTSASLLVTQHYLGRITGSCHWKI